MIIANNITKTFIHEKTEIIALHDVSVTIPEGESLAICGKSGAGKSTLLNIIGGLDLPTSGSVTIDGHGLQNMKEREEAGFRSHHLGFIFQFHHLLGDFTVIENVMLPLLINNVSRVQAKEMATEILQRVGLEKMLRRYPLELSGGEQQRAAIARAVVHKPKVILADEPTGNLDEGNANAVFQLLCELNNDLHATLVMVTHHAVFAQKLTRTLTLDHGVVKGLV